MNKFYMKIKNSDMAGSVLGIVFIAFLMIAFIVAISAAVTSVLWLMYTWVMPQIWPNGPANLIRPSFYLFWGAMFLLNAVLSMVGAGRSSKD